MEVLLAFVVICLVIFTQISILRQRRLKCSTKFLNRSLRRTNYTGINLSIIDGFITLMLLRKMGVRLIDWLMARYGQTFRLPLGTVKTVPTMDPNLIQKILTSVNNGHLNKPRSIYEPLFTDGLKDGLFVAEPNVWAPHRKVIQQAFNYKSFNTYVTFMNTDAENLVKSATVLADRKSNGIIRNESMKEIVDQHAVKIVIRKMLKYLRGKEIIMGTRKFNLSDEEQEEFQENFQRMKRSALERVLNPEQLIQIIWMFHPNKRLLNDGLKKLSAYSHKVADNYRLMIKLEEAAEMDSGVSECSSSNTSTSETEEDIGIKPFECLVEKMIKAGLSN